VLAAATVWVIPVRSRVGGDFGENLAGLNYERFLARLYCLLVEKRFDQNLCKFWYKKYVDWIFFKDMRI
jgi:hypothetical protein